MPKPDLADYVPVAQRIAQFREKHPQGSLQPWDQARPYEIEEVGNERLIVVVAAAYREPGDPRPGVGMASEPYPGKTPYTKGSELMNCFDGDTEALTPDGWMRFDQLPGGMPLMSARLDGTWQFDIPLAYIKSQSSRLITIEDNLTRQVVTPDHRVLLGEEFVSAEKVTMTGKKIPHSGFFTGQCGSLNDASDDYARLLQWVISDGCYPKGNCEPITFGFMKQRKIDRLAALLGRMDITYSQCTTASGRHDFYLGAKDQVVKAVHADIPGKTLTAQIALKFTHSQAVAFIEEAVHTDGTPGTSGGVYVRSVDRGYIESLCLLAAAHGYDATSLAFDGPAGAFPNGKPVHRVRLKRDTRRTRRIVTMEDCPQPVPVYCVTMPLGTVVTRNQGKITVSGQCETSAWGRAIVAVLAADTTLSVASAEEVRNRQDEQNAENRQSRENRQSAVTVSRGLTYDYPAAARNAKTVDEVREVWKAAGAAGALKTEITDPKTGEVCTLQDYFTQRAEEIGFSAAQQALKDAEMIP